MLSLEMFPIKFKGTRSHLSKSTNKKFQNNEFSLAACKILFSERQKLRTRNQIPGCLFKRLPYILMSTASGATFTWKTNANVSKSTSETISSAPLVSLLRWSYGWFRAIMSQRCSVHCFSFSSPKIRKKQCIT